jgi:hypothetical protein
MGEKPILFSTPMVQAILRNEKSMTRRIIKGEKHHDYVWDRAWVDPNGMMSGGPCLKVPYKHKEDAWEEVIDEQPVTRLWPKYQVGDLLWVRETFTTFQEPTAEESERFMEAALNVKTLDDLYNCVSLPMRGGETKVLYKADFGDWADNPDSDLGPWRSPRFMPKWAARIWSEVTGVKVERIQDIHRADVQSEGIVCRHCIGFTDNDHGCICLEKFRDLWQTLNPGSWDRNDWVAAYTFRRVEK